MARNSALRKPGSPKRGPVGWSPENEFFEFETKESTRLNAPREDDPQYKNYKAKFVFQEGGRHCKATPRDKLRINKWLANMIKKNLAEIRKEPEEQVQREEPPNEPEEVQTEEPPNEPDKKAETAEVLATERRAEIVEDERVARNKAEVLAAEVLAEKRPKRPRQRQMSLRKKAKKAEKKAEEAQTEEPPKKKRKKAEKKAEKEAEDEAQNEPDKKAETNPDNGTDTVTDNGASSSSGSSTDISKKAPKAPLPPRKRGVLAILRLGF